jgi:CubicO group peptidase (beta-lactamase class C family)
VLPLRPSRRSIAVALAALLSAPGCTPAPGAAKSHTSAVAARVDSLVAAFQRTKYVPGLSVAVVRGRDTLVMRGYGMADLEKRVPATAETVFPIASLTKQFTAAAVMKLAEERRLSLDDSIGKHLPGLPREWHGLRVRQLLNHTSGIPAHPVLLSYDLAPDSVLARVAKEPLEFAPGTRWSYSNTGYLVLGLLIEKVSGESYAGYLERTMLRPHGLVATHYCGGRPHATGYARRDTAVVAMPPTRMAAVFAAGALCSTAGDLAAWSRALALGRVVSPESWTRMTTPEGAARDGGYGFGLIVQPIEGRRVIGHGGELEGFRSSSAYLPDDSLSVVVLTNLATESPTPLLLEIVRAALEGTRPRAAVE